MNKKFFFSCIICSIIFVFSITFYFNKQTIIESENRTITTFPNFPKKLSTSKIHHFFTQLTNFYNDNFPNREKIILTFNTILPSLKTSNFNLVITGKEDWLFLGNNYENTIDKLTGKFYYHNSKNINENTTNRYNYYNEIVNKISASHNKIFFLIGPNKTSIYPEYLPKYVVPAPQPFHEQLMQKMQQEGLNVYYPRQDLLQAKDKARLYYVTDTHWNQYGAFTAFIHLLSKLDPSFCGIIKEEDFSFKGTKSYAGDLIKIGNLTFNDRDYQDNFEVFYKNLPLKTPTAAQITIGQIRLMQTVNPDAIINKTVWIIGDSFSTALRPFFSYFFKNLYFTRRDSFDKIPTEQLKKIHADFIIYESVERKF